MATSLINHQALTDMLAMQLKDAIIEAAEPEIQAFLEKTEARLRERVVQFALGTIKHRFDAHIHGGVVEIRIRQGDML